MGNTIIVAGYGPGISQAVARKFGSEGYAVALVGRNVERITRGAEELTKAGIRAQAFAADLSQTAAARKLVGDVRTALGQISVLHWNAYLGKAGDLTAKPDELRDVFEVGVHSLLAAVQEALPDLKAQRGGVLVTGGGLSHYDPEVDARAVEWGAMGLAVSKAAQHKIVGLLNKKLAPDGVYAGEVTVLGLVKGTPFDRGTATLEPERVAAAFWNLYRERSEVYASIA